MEKYVAITLFASVVLIGFESHNERKEKWTHWCAANSQIKTTTEWKNTQNTRGHGNSRQERLKTR